MRPAPSGFGAGARMEPPTLGGVPVSVELMRRMGLLNGFKE